MPPGCAVHVTFRHFHDQRHAGIWQGQAFDVQNLKLPLRSATFMQAGNWVSWRASAGVIWPLEVFRDLEVVGIKAHELNLSGDELLSCLSFYPGLMKAKKIFILASRISLRIPASQVAWKHVTLISNRMELSVDSWQAFAEKVETFSIGCGRNFRWVSPVQRCLASLKAGKTAFLKAFRIMDEACSTTVRSAQVQDLVPQKKAGSAQRAAQAGCCCGACEACLHRNGAAQFPAEALQDLISFSI